MHRRLIRRIASVLLALLIVFGPGRTGAWAEHSYDLSALVKSSLTEMFGYTAEEAEGFVTQTQADGSVRFWPEGQPDLVYTLYVDEGSQVAAVSPFETGFTRSDSEKAVRRFLRAIREERLRATISRPTRYISLRTRAGPCTDCWRLPSARIWAGRMRCEACFRHSWKPII